MPEANNHLDLDQLETQEWLSALDNVINHEGAERAQFLLRQLAQKMGQSVGGASIGCGDYLNTIIASQEPTYPGDLSVEVRLQQILRWNAIAMVVRAGHYDSALGGHLASYASSAVLYEVGFNHYFRGNKQDAGDAIFFQGHSSPGIYARAFLEGCISHDQLAYFRQELAGGVCSYPHPRSMPEFWQFPTVSMGLGPLQAIYQARFFKYLQDHDLADTKNRKVWAFCGDGEMDEPESLGAINIAADAGLDNLIFVVNCNLQRLDGPVRGNGSIVRELAGIFAGARWNVIKVLWGRHWDPLFAKDTSGKLTQLMNECVDGDYQLFCAKEGAFIRKEFFGRYPETAALVKDMTDVELQHLMRHRGGHDVQKVNAAYAKAVNSDNGRPTVILAQTVKGYDIATIAGDNNAHNIKKLSTDDLLKLRDQWQIPLTDKQVENIDFYKPADNSKEIDYLKAQRQKLAGFLPAHRQTADKSLPVPALTEFDAVLQGTNDREISSNMALVRVLTALYKDKQLQERVVTVIPDESRTLGLEGLFRQIGIYSPVGQLYTPVDSGQLITYKEDKQGKIIQVGINEAGGAAAWIAAATSYSTNNVQMIPFYFFYSMFGFQRVADLFWAAGDMCARGFLVGGLSGRTSLPGEGLQHDDGHSHIYAATNPACISYDPTYGYEIAVIIQYGLQRMIGKQENIFFYITVMNENYAHPAMPKGAEEGICRGLYLFKTGDKKAKLRVQLLGSGAILREVEAAAELLATDFTVVADIWSAPSFNELARDGAEVTRQNLLNPTKKAQQAYVTQCLEQQPGPIIAATDYMRLYAEQIRAYLPNKHYVTLGTDGFGRSDTRPHLRQLFEVDRYFIVLAALKALADTGEISAKEVERALKKYNIDPHKSNPMAV